MTRTVAEVLALWLAISVPASLALGRVLARIADTALAVQPVRRRTT